MLRIHHAAVGRGERDLLADDRREVARGLQAELLEVALLLIGQE